MPGLAALQKFRASANKSREMFSSLTANKSPFAKEDSNYRRSDGTAMKKSSRHRSERRNKNKDGSPQGDPYEEPPEPFSNSPTGSLLGMTGRKVKKILLNSYGMEQSTISDGSLSCSIYHTSNSRKADRVVILIGDSSAAPVGMWSEDLCVRQGSGGGGIHQGSLGAMLPYIRKSKDEKMGIILVENIFQGSESMSKATDRFNTIWKKHIKTSKASHVFLVTYREGGNVVVEALRKNFHSMSRQISGISFIESNHTLKSSDEYNFQKLIAQWAVSYLVSSMKYFRDLVHLII